MDIKFNIKGLSVIRGQIKVDDIDVGVSGSSEEVINANESIIELIDNPAVQRLINKFADEVSFKPLDREPAQQKAKSVGTVAELCDKVNALLSSLKKEREAYEKLHRTEREAVSELNRRMTELAERNSKF